MPDAGAEDVRLNNKLHLLVVRDRNGRAMEFMVALGDVLFLVMVLCETGEGG